MYHNRRKKKRVNYGVRIVEVVRGPKGFGFTISGQQPCILSCIVQGSPADRAGLRSGDFLIAINGHNVSKFPHDDVVQLINHSRGVLKMQIAENYYSDSSDEESSSTTRSKPKYSQKMKTNNSMPPQLQYGFAKVIKDLQSGSVANQNEQPIVQLPVEQSNKNLHRWNLISPLPLPPPPLLPNRDSEKIVHRTVVGYLGTIDIPNELHPSTMAQVLRKCIKRLKAEKRNPMTVLLTIHVANIKLTNSENEVIAEYPSYRIIFCNSISDQDKQYFGILTKSIKDSDDIISNSCHVFTIYYKLIDHAIHSSTCNLFGFTCTKTSERNVCQEFPDSCSNLIGAIQTLYISSCTDKVLDPFNDANRHQGAVSPQPSNMSTSTAHSSNSDSGIGFKDDCGRNLDVNIAVEYYQRNRPNNNHYENSKNLILEEASDETKLSNLPIDVTSKSKWNKSKSCLRSGDTSTCPGPSASTRMQGLVDASVRSESSTCTATMAHGSENLSGKVLLSSINTKAKRYLETDIDEKLCPKVYTTEMFVPSVENLSQSSECSKTIFRSRQSTSDKPRLWGSMQEMRNTDDLNSDNHLHESNESLSHNNDCKSIRNWVNGFEKLLEDPRGLQAFTEFLKKEFSHENIYFWAACERYKDTEDITSRRKLAWQIYQQHLCSTAAEPVNVDSHASNQITQKLLNKAPVDLFLQAQKQVFNLMKFDSYPRFLRSDIYQHCLETGHTSISNNKCDPNIVTSPNVKLKKSHSDAEDRCRKSILPWHRKNRSKSKDRGESEYNKVPNRSETVYKSFTTIRRETEGNNNDDDVSISSSRSSLASWDLALKQSFNKHSVSSCEGLSNEKREVRSKCAGLCRVILPDASTTVVPTSQTETIKDVITRLLDKRALRFSNYDVLILATDEMVNAKYPSSTLSGREVEVVPTKILKVDLPSRRSVTVIAHKGRTLNEVLKPLLNKYGFDLSTINVWGDGRRLSTDIPAISAPSRLILFPNNDVTQQNIPQTKFTNESTQSTTKLDEITNKVFEELLVDKSTNKYQQYNTESYKSDDQRSEGSSTLSSKFFLRDSTVHGKRKGKYKSSTNEKMKSTEGGSEEVTKSQPPLIAKWRNGVKLQLPGRFEGDELYEGLKRAQRFRLEDQRGTEINFELPDFLKNKDMGKSSDDNKIRRPMTAKFYDIIDEKKKSEKLIDNNKQPQRMSSTEIIEGISDCLDTSNSLDSTLVDENQTLLKDETMSKSGQGKMTASSLNSTVKLAKPPPLPPKPKNLLTNAGKTNQSILSSKPYQKPD